MQQELETLKKWIDNSDNIVFFGGAGVSTESGIPDFRSVDGLYNQQYDYPPETILSHTFFRRNTEEFYRFYRAKMLALDAKPNAAHKKLAQWEQEGKLKAVVTQNIDGLAAYIVIIARNAAHFTMPDICWRARGSRSVKNVEVSSNRTWYYMRKVLTMRL